MSSPYGTKKHDTTPRLNKKSAIVPRGRPLSVANVPNTVLQSDQVASTSQQAYRGLTRESQLFALCYLAKYTQQETACQLEILFQTPQALDAVKDLLTILRREGIQQQRLNDASRYSWYPSLTAALAQREFIDEKTAFIVYQACRSFSRRETADACRTRFGSYISPEDITDILRQCRRDLTTLNFLKETAKIYPWHQDSPPGSASAKPSDLQIQQRQAAVTDEQRAHWALQRHYGTAFFETLWIEAEHTTGLERNQSTEISMKRFHSKLNNNYACVTEWVQRARSYPWWREDNRDLDKARKAQDRLKAQTDARQRIAAKRLEVQGFCLLAEEDLPEDAREQLTLLKDRRSASTPSILHSNCSSQNPLTPSNSSGMPPDQGTPPPKAAIDIANPHQVDQCKPPATMQAPAASVGSQGLERRSLMPCPVVSPASRTWTRNPDWSMTPPLLLNAAAQQRTAARPPPPVPRTRTGERGFSSDHPRRPLTPGAIRAEAPKLSSPGPLLRPSDGRPSIGQLRPAAPSQPPPNSAEALLHGPSAADVIRGVIANEGKNGTNPQTRSTQTKPKLQIAIGGDTWQGGRFVGYNAGESHPLKTAPIHPPQHVRNDEARGYIARQPQTQQRCESEVQARPTHRPQIRPRTPEQRRTSSGVTSLTPGFNTICVNPYAPSSASLQVEPPTSGTVRQRRLVESRNLQVQRWRSGVQPEIIDLMGESDVGSQRSASPRQASFQQRERARRETERW